VKALRTILIGTLVVGTIDALDAIVFFGIRNGTVPGRIFQSIASGLLGRASYSKGATSIALGVFVHYFVAFGIVATFYVLTRMIPALLRRPILIGALYGIGAYFFMNRVVIPLSAIGWQPFTFGPFINGILIHAFGIGIPTAIIVKRWKPAPI
jgi:hypothetical protein